jgi:nucleoside-diphosphate-sugar epimerase
MRKDRIIPVMLDELERKNTITVFGEGERISNFIELDKVLKVTKLLVKIDRKGIFNIGGENLSYLDLANRLIEKYGNDKSKIIRKKVGSRPKFRLDTSKVKVLYKDL